MSESRRIARNSLMLYLRMGLSMIVGFYTSRVVLQTLGIIDYGILGVVGGIVSMMSFINASMSNATSRFISFDLGVSSLTKLQETFNAAFQAHLLIALFVFIIAETVGVWIFEHQLVIPENRLSSARWIYQFSVISAVINVTQTPYSATLIAHEKMDIYAWLEILNVLFKLAVVWLLQILNYDHLLTYGLLSLCISFIFRFVYRLYCIANYPESRLLLKWQPQKLRRMSGFMGWNLFSEASDSMRLQSVSILINRFFGVAVNAASSVAVMVQGAFWALGQYTLTAFRPQIVRAYAKQNIPRMQHLMDASLRAIWVLMSLITVPTIVELPVLFRLWLGYVPPYSVVICQVLLIDTLLGLTNCVVVQGVYAQGVIRRSSLLFGFAKLICIPCIYLLVTFSFSLAWVYLTNVFALLFIIFVNLLLLKQQIPEFKLHSFFLSFIRILSVISVVSAPYIFLRVNYIFSIKSAFVLCLFFCFFLLIASYLYILDSITRVQVKNKLLCIIK